MSNWPDNELGRRSRTLLPKNARVVARKSNGTLPLAVFVSRNPLHTQLLLSLLLFQSGELGVLLQGACPFWF
jgi:hypothetical protein